MKKIIRLWNLGLYCGWLLINDISGFFVYIPKSFPENYAYSTYYDAKNGINIISARIKMIAIVILLEAAGLNIIGFLFKLPVDQLYTDKVIISMFTVAVILNYFMLFKEKFYLKYFKKFEEIPQSKIRIYKIYWAIFILLVLALVPISSQIFVWRSLF